MNKGWFGSLATLAVGGSLALAQGPAGPAALPLATPEVPSAVVATEGDPVLPPPGPPAAAADRVWLSTEYLAWWLKRSPVPVPLVTTTSDLTAQPLAALQQPATTVPLGTQDIDTGVRSGARFAAGAWIDDHRVIGVEGAYFFLASHTTTQGVASTGEPGSPVLAIPFFDADAMAESTFVLASPGTLSGSAAVTLSSRLQGADVNAIVAVVMRPGLRVEVLAGFRYLELREDLTFSTTSTGIQPQGDGSNNGLVLNTQDQFDTDNRFYGWQVGVRGEYRLGSLFVDASAKIALGDMDQTVTVNGAAVTNFFNAPPGGPFAGVPAQVVAGSGAFAQPSNVGRTSRHQIAAVPEVRTVVGYQFAPWARAFVGYDFLYASNVARPGEQIDRTFNVSQTVQSAVAGNAPAPGSRPAVNLAGSGFWAQGLDVGLEFRY
jgi:hypothetical protein